MSECQDCGDDCKRRITCFHCGLMTKRGKVQIKWSFLWCHDCYDCDGSRLLVRDYRSTNLKTACDKMLRFLQSREERSDLMPWVDEDVVEINGKVRKEHFIGDHPLRDYC